MVLAAAVLGVPQQPPTAAAPAAVETNPVGKELFPDGVLTPPDERYKVRLEPSVFFVAPGGTLRLPGSSTATLKLENVDLDRPRMSPFAELHVRSGDWRVSLSGFAVSLNDVVTFAPQAGQIGGLAFAAGSRINSSINFATGDCLVARELGAPDSISGKRDPDLAVSFEAFGGLRFYDVSFNFDLPGGSLGADQFFLQPVVGLKSTLNVVEKFTIDVQMSVGGFTDGADHSSLSYDILVGFMYRPVENVGIQIGYRLYIFDLNDGPENARFDYQGAMAGVYGGVVVRF